MLRIRSSTHKLDTLFVVSLFTLFGITALVLVLIGVKQYKSTASSMNHNYETRTAASYLIEKIRQSDKDASVSVTDFYDTKALTIASRSNDSTYYTYIYFYDGYLRELFTTEHAVYTPEAGQEIVSVSNLSLDVLSGNLIKATITDSSHHDIPVYLSIKSTQTERSSYEST